MSCKSCDLKRIYKLFEEKKRREAESAKAVAEATELAKKQEVEKEELVLEPMGENPKEEI